MRAEEKAKISSPQVAELKASGPGVYFPVVATEYGRFAPGTSAWLEFLQHHAVNKRFGGGGQASAATGSWQASVGQKLYDKWVMALSITVSSASSRFSLAGSMASWREGRPPELAGVAVTGG